MKKITATSGRASMRPSAESLRGNCAGHRILESGLSGATYSLLGAI